MQNLIKCKKYKINVNPNFDCCKCIFWQQKKTSYGAIYYKCIYDTWDPALKKDRKNE